MKPRVSVCVPAYQAAANLQQTLDSVWAQEFEDLELVIVDDGSTDATWKIISAQTDPRLRAFRREANRGQAATVDETIERARGDLIKFLDSDDILHRDCVGAMVDALDEVPDASFVFSQREIQAQDPEDPAARAWIEVCGDLPGNFGSVARVSDGRDLLRRYLSALLPGNWIAEPAGVMARRSDLLAVGGYNRRLRQNNDMDLWVRLMTRGKVVFIDRALFTYRLEFIGVTGRTEASDEPQWLDPLWTAEGLAEVDDFPEWEALRAARRELIRRALHRALLAPLREPPVALRRAAGLAAYGQYRLAARIGRATPVHPALGLD
jgi:glycosyltransferase involved in cell wall biosynthesis